MDKESRNLSNDDLFFLLGLKAKIRINDKEIILIKVADKCV
jgi:hypothetical protein